MRDSVEIPKKSLQSSKVWVRRPLEGELFLSSMTQV